jgi:hypothetical protein
VRLTSAYEHTAYASMARDCVISYRLARHALVARSAVVPSTPGLGDSVEDPPPSSACLQLIARRARCGVSEFSQCALRTRSALRARGSRLCTAGPAQGGRRFRVGEGQSLPSLGDRVSWSDNSAVWLGVGVARGRARPVRGGGVVSETPIPAGAAGPAPGGATETGRRGSLNRESNVPIQVDG